MPNIWWVSNVSFKKMLLRIASVLGLTFCGVLFAQEGFPLKGTWHGNFGGESGTPITLIFNWDGKSISGIVNPGLRSSQLENASLNPSNWTVHFETNYKDRSGAVSKVVVDAKLEDITNRRRVLNGTWTQGDQKSPFTAKRDD
ncbi:MAG: hypothetical protein LBE59_10410 [Nevskiaceae bacterium]|jgi:hypothetical protein|nr:hypothetical protein [Nevskiaceae bacterium]